MKVLIINGSPRVGGNTDAALLEMKKVFDAAEVEVEEVRVGGKDVRGCSCLIVYGEMNMEKIAGKIEMADCIYIGGGDTVYMLDKWKETGLDKLIIKAYEDGKIICGLSAGAICWFKDMYTDYEIMRGQSSEYVLKKGLGVLDGAMCPHFNEREQDFTTALKKGEINGAYCVENDCAIEFIDGKYNGVISAGGKAYYMSIENGETIKKEL